MASVWRARQMSLDRPVAVKILDAEQSASDEDIDRFQSEARSAARMSHPGLVQVYDAFYRAGRFCLVMELVEGATLGVRIRRRGRLSQDEHPRRVRRRREGDRFRPLPLLVLACGAPRRRGRSLRLRNPGLHAPRAVHRRARAQAAGGHVCPRRHALPCRDGPPPVRGRRSGRRDAPPSRRAGGRSDAPRPGADSVFLRLRRAAPRQGPREPVPDVGRRGRFDFRAARRTPRDAPAPRPRHAAQHAAARSGPRKEPDQAAQAGRPHRPARRHEARPPRRRARRGLRGGRPRAYGDRLGRLVESCERAVPATPAGLSAAIGELALFLESPFATPENPLARRAERLRKRLRGEADARARRTVDDWCAALDAWIAGARAPADAKRRRDHAAKFLKAYAGPWAAETLAVREDRAGKLRR